MKNKKKCVSLQSLIKFAHSELKYCKSIYYKIISINITHKKIRLWQKNNL